MMLYLDDVLEGGNTVFPFLGISVAPKVGTALVWQNIRTDETRINETSHAGCPVIIGNKKIATKWINYAGQFLNTPCLEEDHNYTLSQNLTNVNQNLTKLD